MKKIKLFLILILFSSLAFPQSPDSLPVTKNDAPNLYLDCHACDMSFIRTELDYVNYVIDQADADIFIMITRQSTGSNGRVYTLTLEGRKSFIGQNDTLTYVTDQDMSDDQVRQTTLKYIELGLVRYIMKTPLSENLSISFRQGESLEQPEDRWDFWVFKTSLNGWFNGQSTYQSLNMHANISANRITEDWKIRLSAYGSYDEDEYEYDGIIYNSYSQGQSFYALLVKSISDHLSIGGAAGVRTSSYSNMDLGIWINPAVEYNVYPYSESTRREFRFKYEVGYKQNQYSEITIYDKLEESLFVHQLEIAYEIKQPWGSADMEIEGSQYLHDLEKYRFDVRGELSFKMFKGLSFDTRVRYSMIRNQISLPRGTATQEEILLNRQELETDYSYSGSMGISYTFGSIYNNIVNPRF